MDGEPTSPELMPAFAPGLPLFVLALLVLVSLLAVLAHPAPRGALRTRLWPVVRPVLGWVLLGIGVLGLILPGPGIPFFILGVLLVGRRHPLLRQSWVALRLRLRGLARRPGLPGRSGRLASLLLRQVRAQVGPLLRAAERGRLTVPDRIEQQGLE
jgi:hypothetical protein